MQHKFAIDNLLYRQLFVAVACRPIFLRWLHFFTNPQNSEPKKLSNRGFLYIETNRLRLLRVFCIKSSYPWLALTTSQQERSFSAASRTRECSRVCVCMCVRSLVGHLAWLVLVCDCGASLCATPKCIVWPVFIGLAPSRGAQSLIPFNQAKKQNQPQQYG